FTTVEKWEKGIATPPLATIKKLAELFGIDVNTLTGDLSGLNETEQAENKQKYYISPAIIELAETLNNNPAIGELLSVAPDLSSDDLSLVINIAKGLLRKRD
ncbi:MAG: helix-turn-helix transcriptional regulator, partial [Negativicoccus succinicivorans]|nr:helix-turn-helix transcriptional regulator [Negativicoccus succinicivorans]